MKPYRQSRDYFLLAAVAVAVSVVAFIHYYRTDQVLLYGDAVAHINIARRVFDSLTPGPVQLGTVWLPLPHLLLMPFVFSDWAWRTGVGGSIPSMLAYVAGVLGVFRLAYRQFLATSDHDRRVARAAAWLAALVYAANPNLIYLQATAMTEPLYLALWVWATAFFAEFVQLSRASDWRRAQGAARPLMACAFCLAGAAMTRYDGWFAIAVFGGALALMVLLRARRRRLGEVVAGWRRAILVFVMVCSVAPLLWMAYNRSVWGNPVEFATGPYSARGIAQRTADANFPHHPGFEAPRLARLYFLKSARLNLAGARAWEFVWIALAAGGVLLTLALERRLWPWFLLWSPIPFYAVSIAYGGVPLFMPEWYPFSYYNVRYGLQLLPAIAVFTAAAAFFTAQLFRRRAVVLAAGTLLVAGSYASVWLTAPICLREARVNSASRVAFERKLASELARLPARSMIVMYLGNHGGALQRAGIPIRRVIHEGSDFWWPAALRAPLPWVDYVVAMDDDPVGKAAKHDAKLELIARVETPGRAAASIYRRLPIGVRPQ